MWRGTPAVSFNSKFIIKKKKVNLDQAPSEPSAHPKCMLVQSSNQVFFAFQLHITFAVQVVQEINRLNLDIHQIIVSQIISGKLLGDIKSEYNVSFMTCGETLESEKKVRTSSEVVPHKNPRARIIHACENHQENMCLEIFFTSSDGDAASFLDIVSGDISFCLICSSCANNYL